MRKCAPCQEAVLAFSSSSIPKKACRCSFRSEADPFPMESIEWMRSLFPAVCHDMISLHRIFGRQLKERSLHERFQQHHEYHATGEPAFLLLGRGQAVLHTYWYGKSRVYTSDSTRSRVLVCSFGIAFGTYARTTGNSICDLLRGASYSQRCLNMALSTCCWKYNDDFLYARYIGEPQLQVLVTLVS